ncbi:hypothetical protein [uncultured Caulobacter sp.]|uniref:hypothetical protein n=1 Tax=uncultured Caulobacter sp. TaxID=158749 RepID=UPI00260DF0A5|nr:hypothetical protein [uncultured Caulobacter sp.]
MTYDVSRIEIGSDGRVELNDQDLLAMEGLYDVTTAGGGDESMNGSGCVNDGDCSTTNNSERCTNTGHC